MDKKTSTMADSGRKSGRAVFDNQGRASWEWQTATGVFQTDVTNEQMQGLEAAGLALVDSEPAPTSGRVWANATGNKSSRRVNSVTQARNPTVLKRLLRRLSGLSLTPMPHDPLPRRVIRNDHPRVRPRSHRMH